MSGGAGRGGWALDNSSDGELHHHSLPFPSGTATIVGCSTLPTAPRPAFARSRSTIKTGTTRKNFVGPFVLGAHLGNGANGYVRLARHRITGELAAVKILPKVPPGVQPAQLQRPNHQGQGGQVQQQQVLATHELVGNVLRRRTTILPELFEREIAILRLMDHPNIVSLLDVFESPTEL